MNAAEKPIQVVSKRGAFKATPDAYKELEKRFERIEKKQNQEEIRVSPEVWQKRGTIFAVTHFNVFLYATCFFIQVGTMPYLSKKLGADPVTFGQLQTVFAITQLIGGPVYGRLGDKLGERVALIVAFLAATASYFLMGIADNIPLLFLSRLPSVFMHTMQGSQMIVTALSEESDRAKVLSRLGFSYGIGMVAGPSIGGFVTKYFGEQSAALLAAGGSLLSVLLVVLFIPHIPKSLPKKSEPESNGLLAGLKGIFHLFFLPGVGILLMIKLICGIPIGIVQSMFSVIAMERFGLEAEQTGMMLSYIGGVSLVMQGIGIGALTSRYSDNTLMKLSTSTLTIAYFALTLIAQVSDFMLLLFPLTCSLCLVNSILTAAITKTVSRSDSGAILGLNMAVHSAIRSFAPTIGGFLMQTYGFVSLGTVGVVCNLVVMAVLGKANFKDQL